MFKQKVLFSSTSKTFKWLSRQQATAACPKTSESPCRPCIPDMVSVEPSMIQPRVVIVGAGIAGLSAAERLIQCGIKDVILLEALNRPGGRIYTEEVDGTPLDLGAAWISGGCTANTVFSLACQEKTLESPVKRSQRENAMPFSSSGMVYPRNIYTSASRIFKEILIKARKEVEPVDLDLWTYLGKKIDSVAKYFPERDRKAAKCIMHSMTLDTRNSFGSELSLVPLSKYGCLKELPGGDVPVKKGMASVLNLLLKTVHDTRIKYNTAVKKIYWRELAPGESRVSITTCDGQRFAADYVIVTLPLGVLKCFHQDIFEPPLGSSKQRAISKIGLGYINNVCLKFKKPFWIPGEGYIRTCWNKDEIMKGDHWTKSVSVIEEIPTTRDTLYMQVTGTAASQLESLSDCEVLKDVTLMLRRFLGDPSIPMPSHVIRSKWNSHPRFLGSTSFLNMDSFLSDMTELSKPAPEDDSAPSVMFAGEATIPSFQGTTHGARLSGIREAERILNYTKCFCGPPPKPPRTCTM